MPAKNDEHGEFWRAVWFRWAVFAVVLVMATVTATVAVIEYVGNDKTSIVEKLDETEKALSSEINSVSSDLNEIKVKSAEFGANQQNLIRRIDSIDRQIDALDQKVDEMRGGG